MLFIAESVFVYLISWNPSPVDPTRSAFYSGTISEKTGSENLSVVVVVF